MGGVYYVKNILFQFLQYEKTVDVFEIYVLVNKDIVNLFSFCDKYSNVHFLYDCDMRIKKRKDFFSRNIVELIWILRIVRYRIDYVFPQYSDKGLFRLKNVSWIPDFQHAVYPDFFSKEEKEFRDSYFNRIAHGHSKLILSSMDSYNTYMKIYPDCSREVHVVHFISAIDQEPTEQEVIANRKKYEIGEQRFFLVSNQFWKHKNHICLINAIWQAKEQYEDIFVICTGLTEDSRNPEYFSELLELIDKKKLGDNIKILGLIPREDQLALMRDAVAVIQPSLFEGWGTVVEDAKSLGKSVILSDIPVHIEQGNSDCIFFKHDSAEDLSDKMCDIWGKTVECSPKYRYNISNSERYGMEFFEALIGKKCDER